MNVISRVTTLPGQAQGASSTAEFQFKDGQSTPVLAVLKIRGEQLKRRQFKVRAGGRVDGGTTTNFTVNLDAGSDSTIGNNTTIFTSGAKAVNSEEGNWHIEADVQLDETSGKLQGSGQGWINNTQVDRAVITESVEAGINDELTFTVTGTFSASDAGNGARLDYFELLA